MITKLQEGWELYSWDGESSPMLFGKKHRGEVCVEVDEQEFRISGIEDGYDTVCVPLAAFQALRDAHAQHLAKKSGAK